MTARTRAQLIADADTYLPDNSLGEIGAEDVRQRVKDLADSMALLGEEGQPLSGGAHVLEKDLGNLSGQTITLDPSERPALLISNNGAGQIAFHATRYGSGRVIIENVTGAGVITTTAGVEQVGDSFDTTVGSIFLCGFENYSKVKILTIKKKA